MTHNNGQLYDYTSGPVHGVNAVGDKTYSYDANGNQVDSDGRIMQYSAFNKVEHMYKGGTSVSFGYDHNNQRYKRVDVGNNIKGNIKGHTLSRRQKLIETNYFNMITSFKINF